MSVCTVTFIDEVNAKVQGLDRKTALACEKEVSYMLPHAYHMAAYKLGRWDGKTKFFKAQSGNTFIAMLSRILPIIASNGYQIEFNDLRKSSFAVKPITTDIFANHKWPVGHPLEGEPIMLRDDQAESVNIFLNRRYGLMCLPTSYGKTITSAAICCTLGEFGRTLTIVPSTSLVEQTLEDFINVGMDVGGIHGTRKEFGHQHTVTTWQSLSEIFKTKDLDKINEMVDGLSLVLVDECHQAKDATVLKDMLVSYLKDVPYRLGLTGTIPKEDYQSQTIISCLGELIHHVPVKVMQEMGFIARCEVHKIVTNDVVKFKDYASEAAFLSKEPSRLIFISAAVEDIRKQGNTLILVNSIEAGKELKKLIPDSEFVYGQTKQKDRKATYKGVNNEDNTVIIATYQVASVGINIPRIFNLITVESGKSFVSVIQSIGRAVRIAKDKNFARIFDISSNSKYSKKHLKERVSFYDEMEYPHDLTKGEYHECLEGIRKILDNEAIDELR